MSNLYPRAFFVALIIITTFPLLAPTDAEARSYSRRSSSISSLGSKAVIDLPNPILLGTVVSNFTDTWGEARAQGRTHEGTDIFAPRGSYVVSPTDAVVTSAETNSPTNTLGGIFVYTANPGGERFYFAHLDAIADGIVSGKVLKAGDLIGYVGNTGNAAGGATHLHFGISGKDGAENPFPRLVNEFPLQTKMNTLDKIIESSDDPKALAKELLAKYRPLFLQALSLKLTIPEKISDIIGSVATPSPTGTFPTTIGTTSPNTIPTRDLSSGMQGEDVIWLQTFLINSNRGPSAKLLANVGATGYFGTLTTNALAEYQSSANISPAAGYFGPKTRNYIISFY